jgi:glycosyltransferase involved in cell wall biosynthesis
LPIKEQWWGVDVTLFSKANNEFQERPAIWKSTKDQFVIGFVGRFVSEKGVSDLIHSIAALDSRYLLVCIGAGPEKESYIRLAKDLQVFNQLLILPPMPATELANHIAAMNLLALPSHTQTFWKEQYGRVLVEAMAAKIPVIGSRSGAIPYVINDPSCTFQEGDTQGICAAILNALSKTGAQKDALRDRAKLGDANQFAQGFFDLYDQLVKT